MAKIRNKTLFHFTKRFDNIKKILKEGGFWPHYHLEDTSWAFEDEDQYHAFSSVCFCQIPISRIFEHTKAYGRYGFGMKKEWAENKGLNPINYIIPNSPYPESVKTLFSKAVEQSRQNPKQSADSMKSIIYGTAFTKKEKGKVKPDDVNEKNFYEEHEWRYVPNLSPPKKICMDLKEYNKTAKENKAKLFLKDHPLQFSLNDIQYIFVKTECQIPIIFDHISKMHCNNKLRDCSQSNCKKIINRIISLDQLQTDI